MLSKPLVGLHSLSLGKEAPFDLHTLLATWQETGPV